MNYLVPDSVAEADVASVLGQHYLPGLTYLRGVHEDYLRVWYRDETRVYLRVCVPFSAAMVELPDETEVSSRIVKELGLVNLEQAIDALEASEGIAQVRACARLMAMMLTHGMTAEHAKAERVAGLWRRMFQGSTATVAGALFIAGFGTENSPINAAVLELRDDPRWAPLVEQTVERWAAKRVTELPTTDVERLLDRAQQALVSGNYTAAFEAASTAVEQNEYSVQAHVARARACDGLGDHWGAWVAMSAAILFNKNGDNSDFEAFLSVHRPHVLRSNEASPAAREIALMLVGAHVGEIQEILRVFLEHDRPWRARWLYVSFLNGGQADLDELDGLEPDSTLLTFHRGRRLWAGGEVEAALASWKTWAERGDFDEDSFDAFGVQMYERVYYGIPKLSREIGDAVREANAKKDHEWVLQLTDFWRSFEPEDIDCHVWRGIAFTFTHRSEQAIAAYDRAIELYGDESDHIYFGEHPVSTAYFNRACERANAGLTDDQIFDDLYHAVALAPRFATAARTDNYLSGVWEDPRFDQALDEGLIEANSNDELDGNFDLN